MLVGLFNVEMRVFWQAECGNKHETQLFSAECSLSQNVTSL